MPITRSDATALVMLQGIGFVCFNSERGRCESSMIRHGNHRLSVVIKRIGIVAEPNILGWVIVDKRLQLPVEDVDIKISTLGDSDYTGFGFYEPGQFTRLSETNDVDDLRWVLNLEGSEMHGRILDPRAETEENEKPAVSKVFIENALFFAQMPEPGDWNKQPFFIKTDPADGSRSDFGYMSETLGAKLKATEVRLRIDIGGEREVWEFPHIEGSPVKIEISNSDPDPREDVSDLPILYRYLEDDRDYQYVLRPRPNTPGGPIDGREYCHVTRLDQQDIYRFI